VNGSQSKFLTGTWSIFQLKPKPPLFQLGEDYVAIEKLVALGIRLGTTEIQRKTTIDAIKDTCETTVAKNKSKSSSSPHRYFIE
jgi:hypothetical protein